MLAKVLVSSSSPFRCRMRGELLLANPRPRCCKSLYYTLLNFRKRRLQNQTCIPESWHEVKRATPLPKPLQWGNVRHSGVGNLQAAASLRADSKQTLAIKTALSDLIYSTNIYWLYKFNKHLLTKLSPNTGVQKVIKPRKLTHQHRHLQYRRNIARVVVLKYMNTNPKKASWRRVHMPESWRTKKIVLLEETRDKSVQAKIAKGAQT